MITEEQWNQNEANDIVRPPFDNSGQLTAIALVDVTMPADHPALMLEDKNPARAVAVRLVELAEQLPEPPRILRRASDIDDELRSLDDRAQTARRSRPREPPPVRGAFLLPAAAFMMAGWIRQALRPAAGQS